MPILTVVGRSAKKRLLVASIYFLLAAGGLTMIVPFMIMLTASVTNPYDYSRNSLFPRYLWSRSDRFLRGLVGFFPDDFREGFSQFKVLFTHLPDDWSSWPQIGSDPVRADEFATRYLEDLGYPERRERMERIAADYARFSYTYPLDDSFCSWDDRKLAGFFRSRYLSVCRLMGEDDNVEKQALQLLRSSHGLPYDSFYGVTSRIEKNMPMDQARSVPARDTRGQDFSALKDAYRKRVYATGNLGKEWYRYAAQRELYNVSYPVSDTAEAEVFNTWVDFIGYYYPVSETRPFSMKAAWISFLQSEHAQLRLGLQYPIDVDTYNVIASSSYVSIYKIPCPLPPDSSKELKLLWEEFVRTQYPVRNISLLNSPEVDSLVRVFLKDRFRTLANANKALSTHYRQWSDIVAPRVAPESKKSNASLVGMPLELWMEFVQQSVPMSSMQLYSAESAYQQFLISKYGSVKGINLAYGWNLNFLEEAQMPFDIAYTIYFARNETQITINQLIGNYVFALDYMLLRGRGVLNTIILCILTVIGALTVNPLAAYALSRFQLRATTKVIIFCLATSAFPAAVTVIPAYILMRDLNLLNTYAALILPGLASGMSIFLLKGFFDSLPMELYESATLDGAPEWQVFLRITMPLSKPILAVMALFAFLAAYGGWEWALVTCQREDMWTLAVWTYQFSQTWTSMPWLLMSVFVIVSIPTLVVFLLCQNVIMRGIILPSMK